MYINEETREALLEAKSLKEQIAEMSAKRENIYTSLEPVFFKAVLSLMNWDEKDVEYRVFEMDHFSGKRVMEIRIKFDKGARYVFGFKSIDDFDRIEAHLRFREFML